MVGDHPRSRGVYEISITTRIKQIGSSPLARGLLRNHLGQGEYAADHPRSRGVYATFGDSVAQDGGSSPLARGLLRNHLGQGEYAADHPRSRGVYATFGDSVAQDGGSSPLARGLPPRTSSPCSSRGIIPARAGFTLLFLRRAGTAGDHPRSRGVYKEYDFVPSPFAGSSPLARGLLLHADMEVVRVGIIPARAGFTGDLLHI